ncbi:MAG TPA: MATE family efflux transporter [Selenomonadales bacterium]|nr:MATE family efflux transporter [Selenomonadales bacterium]
MNQTYSLRQKTKQFMAVLLPILVTQVLQYAMSLFGAMMAGHASAEDLAGVAIGVNIWMPVYTGLMGILLAVTPLVAHLLGGLRKADIPFVVIQGLYLAAAIAGVVLLAGFFLLDPLLGAMGLDAAVQGIARRYLTAIAFGVGPLFIFTVLRCFIDTLGYTRVTMGLFWVALPVNTALNYALIFGKWGFPCLGGAGAGYATAITYWCITIAALVIVLRVRPFCHYGVFDRLHRFSLAAWKEQLSIGVPIGIAIFCETSIFGVVALFMARFNTATIAAHQAAINFASLLYMIPLSISMALTIAVGFEAGARRFRDARQYSLLGLGTAVAAAVVFAAGLFLYKDAVAGLYTRDSDVLELTEAFLLYAACFQLSDAIATPIQGILRGYKDVTVAFVLAMISYWVIGLPTGYALANYSSYGAYGYWIGLIVGLAIGALFLSIRLIRQQRTMAEKAAAKPGENPCLSADG